MICWELKMFVRAMQARKEPGAELQTLLSCGKPCYRQLPECPHRCEAICHLGQCPASASCQKEVTVSPHQDPHSTKPLHQSVHALDSTHHGEYAVRCAGVCEGMLRCAQVRCACRRKREKRACSTVRQQLADQILTADFDASTAVQLLECDAKCHQIKVRLPV